MKISVFLVMTAAIYSSCCKCDTPRNWEGFRFVDSSGKKNLVYGPDKIYNKDSLRFFYTVGADTIPLVSRPFGLAGDKKDTVTVVGFSQSGKDTTYVDFGNGDIDTLILKYNKSGGGCCDDVFEIVPLSYNKETIVKNEWITIVK